MSIIVGTQISDLKDFLAHYWAFDIFRDGAFTFSRLSLSPANSWGIDDVLGLPVIAPYSYSCSSALYDRIFSLRRTGMRCGCGKCRGPHPTPGELSTFPPSTAGADSGSTRAVSKGWKQ